MLTWVSFSYLNNFFHHFDNENASLFFFNEGFRQIDLRDALCGWNEQGVPLLRCVSLTMGDGTDKTFYLPIETIGDDKGIFYFIPLVARLFATDHISAYLIFFTTLIVAGFIIGSVGFSLLFAQKRVRLICNIGWGLFSFFCFYIMDVYVWAFFLIAFIPLLLWILKNKNFKWWCVSALAIGLLIGFAGIFRNHAGTGLLLLIIGSLFLAKEIKIAHKAIVIAMVIIAMFLPKLWFQQIVNERNQWLVENNFDRSLLQSFENTHIIWHGLYLGLAYDEDNPYGIEWLDEYAHKKANEYVNQNMDKTQLPTMAQIFFPDNYKQYLQTHPEYPVFSQLFLPQQYDGIAKSFFMEIFEKNSFYVLKIAVLKAFKVLWELLKFFNIGLVFFFLVRPPWKITAAVLLPIAFYALPAVLVWPYDAYILGGLGIVVVSTLLLVGNYLRKSISYQLS